MTTSHDDRVRAKSGGFGRTPSGHPVGVSSPAVDEDEATFEEIPPEPSLTDDLFALLEDGRNYAQAEFNYQKSRTGFVANRLKTAVLYGAAAFGLLHLALIAIAVGLVIALAPLIGAWLATFVVGAALIVGGLLFLRALKGQINDIRSVFKNGES